MLASPEVHRIDARIDLFAQKMCGVTPHPWQLQGLMCNEPDIVIVAGRRFGKSMGEALRSIYTAVMYPETHRWIVAPTQDQASIIFNEIIKQTNWGPLRDMVENVRMSPFPEIEWKNGSVIHARSVGHDGKYLRGHQADFLTLDEDAYIPFTVVDSVIPHMMATSKYGWTVKISTPNGRNHFWEDWERCEAGTPGWKGFRFPTWCNPHVKRSFLERERLVRTTLAWNVEYGALFDENQNAVFPWSDIYPVIYDHEYYEDPRDPKVPLAGHRYVIGWDPAQSHDRSAVVVIDVTFRPWKVVALDDLSGRRYDLQEEQVAAYARRYNNAVVQMDATSKFQDRTLQSLEEMGVEVNPFIFTNTSKWELIQGLSLAMQKKEFRIPRHPQLLQELRLYEMIQKPHSGVRILGAPEGHGNYDDYVTALALAVGQARVEPANMHIDWITR